MKTKKYVFAYLIVWAVLLAYFWIGIREDDALFFSMLMITVLPIMTALMSYNVGKKDTTLIRLATVVFSGVMFMLLPYLTFDLLNSVTFHHVNYPEPLVALMGAVVSTIFIAAGMLRNRKLNSNKINTNKK